MLDSAELSRLLPQLLNTDNDSSLACWKMLEKWVYERDIRFDL